MMKCRASTILPKIQQTKLQDRTPNTHTRPVVVTARSSCGVADTFWQLTPSGSREEMRRPEGVGPQI